MNKDVKKCRKCYYENEVGSKNCGQCGEEKWEFNGGIGEYWGFFVNSSKKERSGNSTRDATRKEFALNILRGVGVMFCLCLTPVARFFAAIMMSALGLAESFLQKILKIFLGLMLLIFLVSFFSGERGDDEGRVLYNLTENGKIKVCKFAITAMFSPKNNVVSQGSFVGYEKGGDVYLYECDVMGDGRIYWRLKGGRWRNDARDEKLYYSFSTNTITITEKDWGGRQVFSKTFRYKN